MDYFDTITDQRIQCRTSDLVDDLLAQHLPFLQPCARPLEDVKQMLLSDYELHILPADSIHYKRTALAAIETAYQDDADYLPLDFDERLEAAASLARSLRLELFCAEIENCKAGARLYQAQKKHFEQRAAGCTWSPMPIRICLEIKSGYCLITGSDILSREVTCMRGISQHDIAEQTPALISYLRAKYETQ